ncbi:hypothetical protein BGZ83_010211 [Gryganskiella cystojenkinii]|nr:hypothetical protein BGZ83_010211 [Gryganskiella cystojenkinii]
MLHNTTSAGATTTIIPAEHISTSSQVTTIPSSSLSSPTTVRLWFPEGEQRTRFRQILANAPDPALKMKKKSVRFEQNASSSSPTGADTVASTSIPEELRSKNDCPVASSAAKPPLERKPPQSSSPPSPSSSSTSPGGSLRQLPVGYVYTKVPVAPPPVMVDHKDPEEKLAELMDLKKLRVRQEDLFHLKDQIFQMNQTLEEKEELLDEVRSERKSLQSELNRYVTMIKQIQKDYELTSQAEAQLIKERDDISQQLGQMRESDYKSLKDEVDHMRTKRGFRPLPSLEQEQAEVMGRYLEERRGQWRHGGDSIQGASSSSGASLSDAMLQISLFPETSTAGSSSSSSARVTNNTLADESTSSPSGSGSRQQQ